MDIKDASTNDPSFPLIYYSVNDFERQDMHVRLKSAQYLCVELSCLYPSSAKKDAVNIPDAQKEAAQDAEQAFDPAPPGFEKCVLFQGAVPYASLAQVWSAKSGRLRLSTSSLPKREYVMMRGYTTLTPPF